ncbi:MAG: hypothetical protein ABFS43_07285 [Thermodesulfobacteriota bacterium]
MSIRGKLMREKPEKIGKTGNSCIKPASIRYQFMLCLLVTLFMAATAMAENVHGEDGKTVIKGSASEAKELSGMSIVGNDEAPKSLYIVPWKSSEIGNETSLNAMLNEKDVPVDVEVFKRQLEFYRISTGGKTR